MLSTLEDAGGPLKAYELLGQLKAQGVKAPMTVYRALDRLEGRGMVHKLDGLGAFVVCQHGEPHAMQAFLVCDGCAGVSEVVSQRTVPLDRDVIERVATDSGFTASSARLEIRGHCRTAAEVWKLRRTSPERPLRRRRPARPAPPGAPRPCPRRLGTRPAWRRDRRSAPA